MIEASLFTVVHETERQEKESKKKGDEKHPLPLIEASYNPEPGVY